MTKAIWKKEPEDHDYPAAESYLNLIYSPETAASFVRSLRFASMTAFKAKDIVRASGLPMLDEENIHVDKNISKINKGHAMVPILLVRDIVNGKVVIADGYHRVCAVHYLDEDATIPCQIV
jgi:hypothetical protein